LSLADLENDLAAVAGTAIGSSAATASIAATKSGALPVIVAPYLAE
jgi:hypothetical protein